MGAYCAKGIERITGNDHRCEEERLIRLKEAQVKFFSTRLSRLEKSFEVHRFDHRLSRSGIRKVLANLKLTPEILTDPLRPEFKFFELLKDDDKLYTQRKIVLSIVLTSLDSSKAKIDAIERYYDLSQNNLLELDEITRLLDEIADVSARIIPKIAAVKINDIDKEGCLSEESYQRYTEYLLSSKNKFIEEYSVRIMKTSDSLTFREFATKINSEFSMLLSSAKVRNVLFDMSMENKDYHVV